MILRGKSPQWDDGTTAIRLTQMELMERLVALVPRPKVNLTRYHGVLAPNYKYRKQIVPQQKIEPDLKIVEPDSEPDPLAKLNLKKNKMQKKE